VYSTERGLCRVPHAVDVMNPSTVNPRLPCEHNTSPKGSDEPTNIWKGGTEQGRQVQGQRSQSRMGDQIRSTVPCCWRTLTSQGGHVAEGMWHQVETAPCLLHVGCKLLCNGRVKMRKRAGRRAVSTRPRERGTGSHALVSCTVWYPVWYPVWCPVSRAMYRSCPYVQDNSKGGSATAPKLAASAHATVWGPPHKDDRDIVHLPRPEGLERANISNWPLRRAKISPAENGLARPPQPTGTQLGNQAQGKHANSIMTVVVHLVRRMGSELRFGWA
jgi:hypothetical protein